MPLNIISHQCSPNDKLFGTEIQRARRTQEPRRDTAVPSGTTCDSERGLWKSFSLTMYGKWVAADGTTHKPGRHFAPDTARIFPLKGFKVVCCRGNTQARLIQELSVLTFSHYVRNGRYAYRCYIYKNKHKTLRKEKCIKIYSYNKNKPRGEGHSEEVRHARTHTHTDTHARAHSPVFIGIIITRLWVWIVPVDIVASVLILCKRESPALDKSCFLCDNRRWKRSSTRWVTPGLWLCTFLGEETAVSNFNLILISLPITTIMCHVGPISADSHGSSSHVITRSVLFIMC